MCKEGQTLLFPSSHPPSPSHHQPIPTTLPSRTGKTAADDAKTFGYEEIAALISAGAEAGEAEAEGEAGEEEAEETED